MTWRQKIWVWLLLIGSVYHTVRDILQIVHIDTPISSFLTKSSAPSTSNLLFHPLNTVIIESLCILLAMIMLRRNYFGKLGVVSIGCVSITMIGFVYYWFFL